MILDKTKIRHSFSVRLTLYIFILVSLIFLFALTDYYQTSSKQVKKDAMENAQVVLSNTQQEIEKVLRGTELILENVHWLIPQLIQNKDSAFSITQQVLHSNSFICGCALAFKPKYFKDVTYFSPYSFRKDGMILNKMIIDKEYRYFEHEWLQQAATKKSGVWSTPYYDKFGGEQMMVTYSKPLFDTNGYFYAVITADISLETLENFVHKMNPSVHSYSLVVDRKGNYIVRPNNLYLEKKNLFASAQNVNKKDIEELALRMTSGNNGEICIEKESGNYMFFFAPIKNSNWSVAVGYREKDIFQNVQEMTSLFLKEILLGLVLLAIACYFVIKKMTAPLSKLTTSAVKVANGDFTTQLPVPHGQDEMVTLCKSFDFMQHSLVDYIEKLKRNTIEKERIESDLRIAGEIQKKMVPTTFPTYPQSPTLDVAAKLIPAKAVGGDFYQFLQKDNCFYFIIGDVSGKGIPAALVMSALCRMFRMVAHTSPTPVELVKTINFALAENNETNMFATAFVGALHLSTGILEYCNAGHNASLVIPQYGKTSWMPVKSNLPLGLFDKFDYEGQEIRLQSGDALILYTDGITEAEDLEKELFSNERLFMIAEEMKEMTSKEAVNNLYKKVQNYSAGTEQSDDITIFCINYDPKCKAAYGTCAETKK